MKLFRVALITALAILICVLPFSPLTADGETLRYAYASASDKEEDKTYFCNEKNPSKALFAIPATYCVEILKDDGEWYYCRYARDEGAYKALRGYCLKANLTPIETPLENEYLNYTFPVDFCAEQSNFQIDPFKVTLTVAFYGNGTMNATGMSYVSYNGDFGYVPDSKDDYPRNDIPQSALSTDVTGQNSANASLITAVVITVIAAVAVAVLYFAGKRPKLPPTGG